VVVQHCLDQWERLNATATLRVLNFDEAKAELADYPEWVFDLPIQAFSDILRVHLLQRYGGVWVDATLLPSAPLERWLPPLLEPVGFFGFSRTGPYRRLDSWFLAAKPESWLVSTLAAEVRGYWDRLRRLAPATKVITSPPGRARRWVQRLRRPRIASWRHRYLLDPLFPFNDQGRKTAYYPYFWFHHIVEHLEETDTHFANMLAEMPFWPMSLPLLIRDAVHNKRYKDAEIRRALPYFFAAAPVHKLDWRIEWPDDLFKIDESTQFSCQAIEQTEFRGDTRI
jgi:hypothetical protein